MSAIDDLTTAIARNLSANIIATSVPSFALHYEFGTFLALGYVVNGLIALARLQDSLIMTDRPNRRRWT